MPLLVHGGAGSKLDNLSIRSAVLDCAVQAGVDASNPLTAAVRAVRVLETDPRFNAGTGSAVQSDGVIRTDAGVMTDSAVGAACSMLGVEHAVSVARIVAEETPHVLVSGEHAVSLADAFDIPTQQNLWSEQTRKRWAELSKPTSDSRNDHLEWVREQFGGIDTVGAVATNGKEVAAATSTGGRWCTLAGRVGDVPQIGAGFYASTHAAASTTGAGEAIARFGLARKVVETIEDGTDPQTAAAQTITEFESETGSHAGVIAIGIDAQTGSAFNAEGMQTAYAEN